VTLSSRAWLLALLSAAQLGATSWSIVRYETTLAHGALYKVKTVPVDPADPFRGRYVAIQPAITLPAPVAPDVEQLFSDVRATGAYVVLTTGEDGFARAAAVVSERPASGDFLEIARAWRRPIFDPQEQRVRETRYEIVLPFDRYYMNEAAAPAAERRYQESVRQNANAETWVAIRVRNGTGVVEGLYIDGVTIEEAIGTPVQGR
jgi:uncharacterized membrane-anchored protein